MDTNVLQEQIPSTFRAHSEARKFSRKAMSKPEKTAICASVVPCDLARRIPKSVQGPDSIPDKGKDLPHPARL